MSEKTIEELKKHRVSARKSNNTGYDKAKYSKREKQQKLLFITGYDLLQYSIVVRPYIIRKHRLENQLELDILLYLFPFQYFTFRDFKVLPTENFNYHLQTLIDLGFIEVVVQHAEGKGSNIYGLTERSKKIVREYYEYLSGEKTVKPNSYTNPFADKDASKVDAIRQKVLNKLTRQTRTRPSFYRKKLYDF